MIRIVIYRNNLKNREYGKEAAQIFVPGASDHCLWQGARISQKFAAKPTTPKTDSSGYFGITTLLAVASLTAQALKITQTPEVAADYYFQGTYSGPAF